LLCAPVASIAITLVLGTSYEHARLTVVVYMVGRAVAVLNQLMASVLTARGHERPVTVVIVVAAALGLFGGVAFVGRWGSVSLGLGFLVTQVIVAVGCARLLYDEGATIGKRRSRRGAAELREA
jgi:O-antigen/teichoic acid export membrane protein